MAESLLQSRYFASTHADLHYMEGPANGMPVLLLHGIASRWQPFQAIVPALSEKHHVFALDLRGHGLSSHTPGGYHLQDFTGDVQEFIRQQVQKPVVVYGHSLGGLVGINLAAQQPEWVRSLVLGDPPLYHHDTLTKDTFWQSAFTELLDFKTAHPDPLEMDAWLAQKYPGMPAARRAERVDSLAAVDPDVVRAVLENTQMAGVSLPALASCIKCPVCLLRGSPELGSALRPQDLDFARRHFANLSEIAMQTVGHGILPAALLPELCGFIDRLE